MKKVLIITDLYYASPRIPGLCKYLNDFGWGATILTTPIGKLPRERLVLPDKNTRIIEVPYKDIAGFWKNIAGMKRNESVLAKLVHKIPLEKKSFLELLSYHLFIWGGTVLAYPDEMRSWRKPAIKAGQKLLKTEHFDAILSSSFPVTSHRIAMKLTKQTTIPWLSDLRDLWTQNHNYLYPWRKILETKLEKKTLSRANFFSTISAPLSEKLISRYPNKTVKIISNGFDPELINEPPTSLTKDFTITYTGLSYQGKQDPAKLFKALRELFDKGLMDKNNVSIRYYGVVQKWICHLAKAFGLENNVTQHGPVLRDVAIAKQRESQLLLMYGWEDEYETGVLPLKMFEYFAARRPILAVGGTPKEQFRHIFNATKAGRHAIDMADTKKILLEYYDNYLKTGAIEYHGIPSEMAKYSHREMAKKFTSALNEMIQHYKKDKL